jgi:hypothetical protein
MNLCKEYLTAQTAKYRVSIILIYDVITDNKLIAIALEDAYFLGTLSSKIHVICALAGGGRLENRPVYVKTTCFDPFLFPDATPEQKQKIRELGGKLDAHRKQSQNQHPEITITGIYNLLEKLPAGQPFTDSDKAYNDKALFSMLKQIYDELYAGIYAAYDWEKTLTDEEILSKLVALNAERGEEESKGIIHRLCPKY